MQAVTMAKGQARNPLRKRVLGMVQLMPHKMTPLMEPSTRPWTMLLMKRPSPNGMTGMMTW
jgi:hypothetical protein